MKTRSEKHYRGSQGGGGGGGGGGGATLSSLRNNRSAPMMVRGTAVVYFCFDFKMP